MKTKHHVTVGRKRSGARCRTIRFGSHIQAIICYPKGSRNRPGRAPRGKGKGRVISLRFDPKHFTLGGAKKWAREHDYKVLGSAKADTNGKKKKKKTMRKVRTCANRGCSRKVRKPKGPGRPPKYCWQHRTS